MAGNFDAAAISQAVEMKTLHHERAKKEPSITDLGKFDLDDFDVHEDAFLNLFPIHMGT